jgi:hypothetical protein
MGYQRAFNLFVVFLLIFSVFANSALAETCLCGQTCRHGLQAKSKIKTNSLFHMRCSGTLCKSCDLEEGQTYKAANAATRSFHVKNLNFALILSAFLNHPFTCHIRKGIDSFYAFEAVPSSPIYLQQLSFRC